MSPVCEQIHQAAARLRRHRPPFDPNALPANGVYLLYEAGEQAHGVERIVRIGTHTGQDDLPNRLKEHFLVENKDRSIFRKNIGRALLSWDDDAFLTQWEWDLTSRANRQAHQGQLDTDRQVEIEQRVTERITGSFSFAVLPVDGDPASRLALEAGLVATIAQCPECGPSDGWLGRYSPKPRIRETGLWQERQVNGMPLAGLPPEFERSSQNQGS